jgi:hypothetical protein
MNVVYNLDFSQ